MSDTCPEKISGLTRCPGRVIRGGVMKIAGTIDNILRYKGGTVWTISPEATIYEALEKMAEKNVGALLVMSGEQVVGVFSERDYARNVVLKGRSSRTTKVGELLSRPVITVTPEHTVDECMRLMTEHRIRHLPVLKEGKLVGLVSIGDLVNWIISAQSATLDQMQAYITGSYPK